MRENSIIQNSYIVPITFFLVYVNKQILVDLSRICNFKYNWSKCTHLFTNRAKNFQLVELEGLSSLVDLENASGM